MSLESEPQVRKALVVEDDPDTRNLLETKLTNLGFQVTSVEDGVGCMSALAKAPPDVIVLDLSFPAGGGYLTLDRIRAHPAGVQVPVFVLTADESSEARLQCHAAGATGYFRKRRDGFAFFDAIDAI